jgi:hypothetical protein
MLSRERLRLIQDIYKITIIASIRQDPTSKMPPLSHQRHQACPSPLQVALGSSVFISLGYTVIDWLRRGQRILCLRIMHGQQPFLSIA